MCKDSVGRSTKTRLQIPLDVEEFVDKAKAWN